MMERPGQHPLWSLPSQARIHPLLLRYASRWPTGPLPQPRGGSETSRPCGASARGWLGGFPWNSQPLEHTMWSLALCLQTNPNPALMTPRARQVSSGPPVDGTPPPPASRLRQHRGAVPSH